MCGAVQVLRGALCLLEVGGVEVEFLWEAQAIMRLGRLG